MAAPTLLRALIEAPIGGAASVELRKLIGGWKKAAEWQHKVFRSCRRLPKLLHYVCRIQRVHDDTLSPMKSQEALIATYLLRLGILLYPAYFILDWFIYPRQKYYMLAIRIAVAAYLFVVQCFFARIKEKYQYITLLSCFFVVSFGLSLMCFISGQGFSSPYFVGILQIILISTLFKRISKRGYAILIAVIVVQHFVLLLFAPWSLNGLLINVFGLCIFAIVAIYMHNIVYGLARENKELKGILPICARCNKIRDDEGYWKEVSSYIRTHTDVEFSHGICPECMQELYPEYMAKLNRETSEKRNE